MFKVLIGSILFFLLSSNSFAENCIVSDALKNRVCSVEYFKARSEKELNDYLLNGKFKDGKLLNLEISFNIKEKEINIATSCDLKISRERGLFAKLNGICLKGSSVRLEGENELVADKNASIDISALNSVIIRRSSLETKGELSIATLNFLPLNGEVLISRESILKARNIHINSKSSLIINSESKLKADNVILDGGNCEINDKNDRDNDDDREHGRECRKFKPQFLYSGTCANNPLPTNFKINSLGFAQVIDFSIENLSNSAYQVNWKLDRTYTSIDSRTSYSFNFPGRHLAEAVVIGNSGYFRKLSSYINTSIASFNKNQLAVFQFLGSANSPKIIHTIINQHSYELTKLENNPELYSILLNITEPGAKNISVPMFNYQARFNLNILPIISDPNAYINSQIENLLNKISAINSTKAEVIKISDALTFSLNELRTKINTLSFSDKLKMANFLQSMTTAPSSSSVMVKNKYFNIINFLISTASAAPIDVALDLLGRDGLRNLIVGGIGIIGAGTTVWLSYALVESKYVKGCGFICSAVIVITLEAALIKLIASAVAETDSIIDSHLPKKNTLIGQVIGSSTAGQETIIRLRGSFIPVNATPLSSTPLVLQAINRVNNDNTYIGLANNQIDSLNQILASFNLNSTLEKIPLVTFPQTTVSGFLSPSYITSAELVSPTDGSASVQLNSTSGDNVSIIINSNKSQTVTVKLVYANNDLGVNQDIIVNVPVLVAAKAVINYTKNNLQVNFNSTDPQDPNILGLKYVWNFGDGQTQETNSKIISHTYNQAGTYNVSLTITDSSNSISSTSTTVQVTKGCVGGCGTPDVKIKIDGAVDIGNYNYNLNGFAGFERKINVDLEDLNNLDGNTEFQISWREYSYDTVGGYQVKTINVTSKSAQVQIPFFGYFYVEINAKNLTTNLQWYRGITINVVEDAMPQVTAGVNCYPGGNGGTAWIGVKDYDSSTLKIGIWYPNQQTGEYEGTFLDGSEYSPYGYFYLMNFYEYNYRDQIYTSDLAGRKNVRMIYRNSNGKVGYIEVENTCLPK